LKRKRPKLGDKWFLDEVFVRIDGVPHYLSRAVDQHGVVIDILVQPKRDRFAAIRFFRKLLRTSGRHPRVIITDRLRDSAAISVVPMTLLLAMQSCGEDSRALLTSNSALF
jgi:putative transposase